MNAPAAVEAVEFESESSLGLESDLGLDVIDEMRLRTWARRNYTPEEDRDESWHPIVLDEMRRKDEELD